LFFDIARFFFSMRAPEEKSEEKKRKKKQELHVTNESLSLSRSSFRRSMQSRSTRTKKSPLTSGKLGRGILFIRLWHRLASNCHTVFFVFCSYSFMSKHESLKRQRREREKERDRERRGDLADRREEK